MERNIEAMDFFARTDCVVRVRVARNADASSDADKNRHPAFR
jgi:hypothetical protein